MSEVGEGAAAPHDDVRAAVVRSETMLTRRVLPYIVAATASLVTTVAWADVIDPTEDACGGKQAGDACDLEGGKGVCRAQTCGRLDYSDGVPPKTKNYECLRCEDAGAPTPTPDGEAAPEPDRPTAPADAKSDADANGSPKPTGKATPSDAEANAKDKGCAVGKTTPLSLGVGLGLLALVALGRHRSRTRP